MLRYDLINKYIKEIGATSYLEIGVFRGDCFRRIVVENKQAVDPNKNSAATIFKTSDDYFKDTDDMYDVVFIDGMHEGYQVYRDIKNSLKHLNKGGVILLHDCNPPTKERQRPFEPGHSMGAWNGDCWKGFVKFRTESNYLTFTYDTDEGVGVIDTRYNAEPLTGFDHEISEMTYEMLVVDRQRLLNLRKV